MAQKSKSSNKKGRRKERARRAQQPEINTKALWGAAIFAGIGVALSLYATNLTYMIATGGLDGASGCSINDWINCDLAHSSSYSRLMGIPVSWWGLLFYVFAGLAALNGVLSKNRSKAASYLTTAWILSIFSVLFSIYKATNLVELRVLCPVCVGMYAANIGLMFTIPAGLAQRVGAWASFLSSYLSKIRGKESTLLFEPKPVTMLVTLAVLFGVGWAVVKNYEDRIMNTSGFDLSQQVENHFRQRQILVDPGDEPAVWGNPDAEITIVEFADFQCPGCAEAAARFKPALWEFRHDVKFVFMNYPLDIQINDQMKNQLHSQAGGAARASVCAQEFGDFWDFHDELFRNQVSLGMPLYVRMAERRGWDTTEFAACMARDDVTARVKSDIALAGAVNVAQTPTIYVDGRRLGYWSIPEFVQAVVREALRRKG